MVVEGNVFILNMGPQLLSFHSKMGILLLCLSLQCCEHSMNALRTVINTSLMKGIIIIKQMIRGIPYLIDQIHWILWNEIRGRRRRGVKLGIASKSPGTPTSWNLNKSIDPQMYFPVNKGITRSWANVQWMDWKRNLSLFDLQCLFLECLFSFLAQKVIEFSGFPSFLPTKQIWVWTAQTVWDRRIGYCPFMFKLNAWGWHMEYSGLKVQQFKATESLSCFQLLKSVIQLVNKWKILN